MTSGRPGIAALFAIALLAAVGAAAQAPPDRFRVTEQFVEVTDGTTMFHLVREHYPSRRNGWLEVAHDLAAANPDAFRNGDPGAMIVGQRVYLIDYGEDVDDATTSPDAATATPASSGATQAGARAPAPQDGVAASPPAGAATRAPDAEPPVPPVADPAQPVGQITRLRGQPTATDADNRARRLGRGGDVFRGDTLITGEGGELSLLMNDGMLVHVRAGSRVVLESYGTGAGGRVLTLPGGALRIVAAREAHGASAVLVNTAVATIGAGAADVALRICADGSCLLEDASVPLADGLYCAVAGGRATISNNTGETPVERGEVVRVRGADRAPKAVPEALAAAYTPLEMSELDLHSDEPLGFWAWFRQRFF